MSGHRMIATQRTRVNLMVVRSQCMDADPRASAAHSHMLKSQRNKGRSEVVRVGANNPGLNTSKNMFNRMGRGTDMKKTLNRRRE